MRATKHRTDLSPLPWLLLAFLLGVATGLLLDPSRPAEAAEPPEEEPLPTVTTSAAMPRRAVPVEPDEPDEPEEPAEPRLVSMGLYKITAYCPCKQCCGKSDGITATGTVATEGRTIAVDPSVIPYGSVVYFEGADGCIGGYVAEDCGGAVKGNHIDLYFDTHAAALSWGVREMEVFACD